MQPRKIQLKLFVLARGLKLSAAGSVQPNMTQLPLSRFAIGLKLEAIGLVQPGTMQTASAPLQFSSIPLPQISCAPEFIVRLLSLQSPNIPSAML